MSAPNWVVVAAGAILSADRQQVLLAKRRADQHQGDLWEFPGGKIEPNESADLALARELQEEIGITVETSSPLVTVEHEYSDKAVRLDVFLVERFSGEPTGLEGQTVAWVPLTDLSNYQFPEANVRIVQALRQALGQSQQQSQQ